MNMIMKIMMMMKIIVGMSKNGYDVININKMKICGNDTIMIAVILLNRTWAHMTPMKMIKVMVIMTLMMIVGVTINGENVWL